MTLCMINMLQAYGNKFKDDSEIVDELVENQRQLSRFIQVIDTTNGRYPNSPPSLILPKTAFNKAYVDHVNTYETLVNKNKVSSPDAMSQIINLSKEELNTFNSTLNKSSTAKQPSPSLFSASGAGMWSHHEANAPTAPGLSKRPTSVPPEDPLKPKIVPPSK